MRKNKKSAEIKTRVEPTTKFNLEQIASRRGLDLSDIARQAFNDYLARNINVAAAA